MLGEHLPCTQEDAGSIPVGSKRGIDVRTISCDDAINEISEILIQASGEWITEIYNKVSDKKAVYEGDSIMVVMEEGG